MDDNQLHDIPKEVTVKAGWDALKKHAGKSFLTNKVFLIKRSCRMQLSDNGNMEDHFNVMMDIVNQLKALGETRPSR